MPTIFPVPHDGVQSTLAAPYAIGNTSISVATGDGPKFGTPSASAPVRVTLTPTSNVNVFGRILDESLVAYYRVTGRTGDSLTGLTFDGGADQAFATGAYVLVLLNAESVSEIHGAVNATEAAIEANAASIAANAASVATKAPLDSPAFTGIPTAPTATAGTNTTQVASTAFVAGAVTALVDSAPGTLDTLNELAAALGDDTNFAATVTASLAAKADDAAVLHTTGDETKTGTLTAPLLDKGGAAFNLAAYGAHADGSDDSTALNAAIAAAHAAGGGTVLLGPHTHGIGATPLDPTKTGITLRGVPGKTILKKTVANSSHGIFSLGALYVDWIFENIIFDGSYRALLAGGFSYVFAMFTVGARNLRFTRCEFRDLRGGSLLLSDCDNVVLEDCTHNGQPIYSTHQTTRDPAPVPSALATDGIVASEQAHGLKVLRNTFSFCRSGVAVNTQSSQMSDGVTVEGSYFHADYWDSPNIRQQFVPTSVSTATGGTVTLAGGGFAETIVAADSYTSIAWRYDLASGTSFSRLFGQQATLSGATLPLAGDAIPRYGDVIETDDGRRARIVANVSGWDAGDYWVDSWVYSDDRTPCDPPSLATAWHLCRYYGSTAVYASDTTFTTGEPVNPIDGRLAHTDDGLDLSTLAVRVFAKTTYSGIQVNANCRNLTIAGNRFRGSWADQCSAFNCPEGVIVRGNHFEYGQDESITLTGCPRSTVVGNTSIFSGTSLVFLGSSDHTAVVGNTVHGWGVNNGFIGAVDGAGLGLAIVGNTLSIPDAEAGRAWCAYAYRLFGADCTGTVIAGNTGDGTTSTLDVDSTAAPASGAIVARDAASVSGAGAANVSWTDPAAEPPATLGANVFDGTQTYVNSQVEWRATAGGTILAAVNANGNAQFKVFLADELVTTGAGRVSGHNVEARNSFYFPNSDLLMQAVASDGDTGNAYVFTNASGSIANARQIQVSSGRFWGTNPATIGVVVRGAASQTEVLQSWQSDDETQLAAIGTSGQFIVGTNQVVGAQGAAVADATDAASVITQLNQLLARLRAHGLIAT